MSKGHWLARILFLLKLNPKVLCNWTVALWGENREIGHREKGERWGWSCHQRFRVFSPYIWTDESLTEMDSTSCQTLDVAVPEGELATKCILVSCLDACGEKNSLHCSLALQLNGNVTNGICKSCTTLKKRPCYVNTYVVDEQSWSSVKVKVLWNTVHHSWFKSAVLKVF